MREKQSPQLIAIRPPSRLVTAISLHPLVVVIVLLITSGAPRASASVPEAPIPLLIKLRPPISGKFYGLGSTAAGDVIISRDGYIEIFNGLYWRLIQTPNAMAQTFADKPHRLWISTSREVGWINIDSSNSTYHPVVTGLKGLKNYIFDAGDKLVVVSADTAYLLTLDGNVLSKESIPFQPMRWSFRWQNGWVTRSMEDTLYITINSLNHLSITKDLPFDAPESRLAPIISAFETSSGTFLMSPIAAFGWDGKALSSIWQLPIDQFCRHFINAIPATNSTAVIRVAGEGLDGFSGDLRDHLWQAPVGSSIDGNITTYPITTAAGTFFVTTANAYWIPSPSNARKLTNPHQVALGVCSDHTGFWVCTSDGSWHVETNSWQAKSSYLRATYAVTDTAAGLVRGQLPSANIDGKLDIGTGAGGQVQQVCSIHDGFALIQPGTISKWSRDLRLLNRSTIPGYCTSAATLNSNQIILGTEHAGALLWSGDGTIHNLRDRGDVMCTVCSINDIPIIIWSDGIAEIGNDRIQIPTGNDVRWTSAAAAHDRIIVGGVWRGAGALMLISQINNSWKSTPLDHPALNEIREIESVALCGNRVAIAGVGGCYEIALAAFDRDIRPPESAIALVRACAGGETDPIDNRNEFANKSITLAATENEVKFALNGGPTYWKQRVKFAYRLLPDSTDWTDLDPAKEVDIQRIAAGNHTLEIESRSIAGTATSRYTIIRPPYWYASHWAFGAYGLSLMGATAGFFVWRTRRLRVRARVLEERVAQRTAELKKANEAKDEFLASMSHEIRNPLNGVIGLSGMLQESVQTERDRRLIESLRACADQLRLVLDDVLDFSVIERGDVQLQLAPFNPAAAIRAAVVAVDAKLERTRVTFGPKLADGLWLRGDEGKLRQIVSNLVSNAHKYGVPPEAKVDARLHDSRLIVTISNTGPDIPPDDQARIFASFERGRSAAHKYVRGAGLGLTISSRFARAMGGEITVKSENGLTSFAASIPAPVVEKPAHAMAASAAPPRGVALAIEDEPYNRLVLGHVLSGLGFEVEWAQNGTDALDILKSGRPYAMIFTDWMLPDMQGSELVRQIKQLRGEATPPMVAVTAYATAEKRAEAFDAGVAAFVTKPITPEKIEGAVQANAASDAPSPSIAQDEPLRVGILLDGNDAAERVTSFRTELLQHMAEIETALRQHDSDRTARTAHRLASQLLAIHHHTFADELRALETAALRYQWDLVRDLYANATRAASSLSRQLETLAHSRGKKPASDRP